VSLLDRVLASFGIHRSTGEVVIEGDRVVLKDLRRARSFPQEPKDFGRKEILECEQCRSPLRKVVFTTAGSGDQIEIWRQYPLAVDGWVCPSCGWSAMPRCISAEESTEYGRQGVEHASSGQFDDAEFWFRRIIGSWPRYAAGYADLGQLSCDRAEAERSHVAKQRHRSNAVKWLRRAVALDPERQLARTRFQLARVLALTGAEDEALAMLEELLDGPALPPDVRVDADTLAGEIREGRALFTRATEMVRDLTLEAPRNPLDAAGRRTLEEARALLRRADKRKRSFATSWFIGKVEMRLGNAAAALVAFQEAHDVEPTKPDGCRELVAALLEVDRAQDALPVAKRAVDLRPDDAGLRCNLALVLLLTGDVATAQSEATAALEREPTDTINRGVAEMIDDVVTGRRQRPRSLAEAEGRKPT
jgi:tetratricopeptide (TPR) repeat protein